MIINRPLTRKAALLAAATPFAIALATPAFAQDASNAPVGAGQQNNEPASTNSASAPQPGALTQDAEQASAAPDNARPGGNDIVVTGTLIRNSATATAAPIDTLTAQDFANRGQTTVAEALQTIPANGAGAITRAWNSFGFSTGATAVSLRGLTTQNTLTLFDGLRTAIYPLGDDGVRSFVDLNTIPEAIVEKVDVLQDGASSTYGADAVAGVVNVIVKKEITGVHLNVSSGVTQYGDNGEQRVDATVGYGKLSEQGFNVYLNAEFQHDDPLYARDRGYPFNTANWSGICNGNGGCLDNEVVNGPQANGNVLSIGSTQVPVVRPYLNTATPAGNFQLLNTAAGCRQLSSFTLSAAQQASLHSTPTVCEQDNVNEYLEEIPAEQRFGATAHLTANVGSNAQAYLMANYYETQTDTSIAPLTFAGTTAASAGPQFTLSPVFLPVYVCPRGTTAACTAANGTLNPNNPFAAAGELARLNYRYDEPRRTLTDTKTYRLSGGLSGSFGGGWNYSVDGTYSQVDLRLINENYLIPQRLLDVINDGSFNFVDPSLNTQATRDYIAPTNTTDANSKLWQVQGTLSKSFFSLPGGDLTAAVGVAYRHESVYDPSGNPPDAANPADRYYSINEVSTIGSRNVRSAFFEIDAPILDQLTINGSGRYDNYSSGQKNFSPKIEAVFKPIQQLKIRGTYSRGFSIPSFGEAYGSPTTGYVTDQVTTARAGGAAYLAAHGGDAYATQPYSYGLTSESNAHLNPEKSTSLTGGIVFQPNRHFDFTVDYFRIRIKDQIGAPDYSNVAEEYYANNGVVNEPGITVLPDPNGDPDHPGALPALGYIQYQYINTQSELSSGLDFSGTARLPLGHGISLTSRIDASYLLRLEQTLAGGEVQRFDGSLSPCNVTSCSGAPKWRGSWSNTLDFGRATLTAVAYYTGSYSMASTDYGGNPNDCVGSIGESVYGYDDGTPYKCRARRFIDVDMTGSIKAGDHFTIYANVLNVFNTKPDFDPGQTYDTGFSYNVAWESQGFIGRYVRIGAKVDW